MSDELDQDIREVLLEVTSEAIGGDLSWWNDLDKLVELYDLKELDPLAWNAPLGSFQREVFEISNREYIKALARWEKIWSIVIGNHQKGNPVTYEMISDMLIVNELKKA